MIGRGAFLFFWYSLLLIRPITAQEISSGDGEFDRRLRNMDTCTHVHDSIFSPCPGTLEALQEYYLNSSDLRVHAHYYAAIGGYYNRLGMQDSSLYYLHRVLDLGPEADLLNYFRALVSLGATYYERGEYSNAILYLLKAQELESKVYWPFYNGLLNNYMGILYFSENGYEQALPYFIRAARSILQIEMRPEKKYLIQNVLNNIGLTFYQLKRYREAIPYFHLAWRVSVWDKNNDGISISLSNLARTYKMHGKQKIADYLYLKSVEFSEKTLNPNLKARSLILYIEFLFETDREKEVEPWINRANELLPLLNEEMIRSNLYRVKAKDAARRGNYEQAYYYEHASLKIQEDVLVSRGNKLIQIEKAQGELRRIRNEQEDINYSLKIKDMQFNAIAIGGSVLVILMGVIIYLWISVRRRLSQTKSMSRILRKKSGQFARANRELELANKHKNYILNTVDQELRNILSNVIHVIGQIAKGPTDKVSEQQHRQWLKMMKTSAKLGLITIQDVNDAFRPGKQMRTDPVPILPDALLAELRELMYMKCKKKKIQLVTHNRTPFLFTADREKIIRILVNIMDNAIKFSKPGGKIIVSIAQSETHEIEISIRDFGTGIPQSMRNKLFKPFTEGISGTDEEPANGLGLYIARKLVRVLKGKIQIRTRPGTGTLVKIQIPQNQ